MALIPGNLLDELMQSINPNDAGWTSTGATQSAFSGEVYPDSPGMLLRLVSTGTADAVAATVMAPPVAEGTTYLGYGWCAIPPGSAATSVTAEIRWLDAADTVLSTDTRTWTVDQPEVRRRINVMATAPTGAVSARLAVRNTSAASGYNIYWDEFYLGEPPNPAGNLLTYDEYSVELSQAGWAAE